MNVLLTGGASGLGLEIFLNLVNAGHTVYFTYCKSSTEALRLTNTYKDCNAIHCDFKSPESIASLLKSLESIPLDALVNNALPSLNALQFQKTEMADLVSSFTNNVIPVLNLTQACLTKFRKQRSGKVITILTSYLVNRPPVGYSEYISNKAYILAMSKSWAVENAKFGISVNCVSPSTMRTGLTSETDDRLMESLAASNPFGRLVEPKETARIIEFLLSAPLQLNSTNLILNGGSDVI